MAESATDIVRSSNAVLAGSVDYTAAAANMERLKELPSLLNEVYKSVLQEGTDYGKIPGTPKPSLWKPGAELLCKWLEMVPNLEVVEKQEETLPMRPFFYYKVECRLLGKNGYLGNGFGSANSREPTFARRWVFESELPRGSQVDQLESRKVKGGTQYKIQTPDEELYGMANTILKRASKRAFVEAVLRVTGASRIFTQDVEDSDAPTAESGEPKKVGGVKDLTEDELQYELRQFATVITIQKVDGALRVVPAPNLLADTSALDSLKTALSKWPHIYVPRSDKEKAYFEIRVAQ